MKQTLILLTVALLTACGVARTPGRQEPNPLEAPPVDSARVRSADEAASWGYRREVTADLDGDGEDERVVLAAEVAVDDRGRPLWEDGQRWGVLVIDRGPATLVYGAFVPAGFVEVAVLVAGGDGRRRILIQERTPQQLRAIEVEYLGPGRARTSSAAYYQVEEWLPGSAVMP